MTYTGVVKNGVVVLDDRMGLSDGTVVQIRPIFPPGIGSDGTESIFQLGDRAKSTGVPDLAVNHDHYLYGHPKINHG